MEKVNTDELIPKLISGTYEEFCENIVVFLKLVSIKNLLDFINNEMPRYLPRNVKYIFFIETSILYCLEF